ncbi:hypothetical protein [Nitriliruptor alkaliphilus]|uniref:hypothetical protein n=1 Tax=Nitriliruptor alkaliphilus TaxID=427918 RepID=UPI000698E7C9|nr:hypothetical protein [Nitriliruptor alkaliphilus]
MTEQAPTAGGATLRSVQALWLSFTAVVALAAVLVPFVVPDPDSTVPALLPTALAAAAGIAALVGIVALDRGLIAATPADDRAAVAELRSRLVMQAAIAEAPALLAVALAFVLGPPWAATAGALPGLIGLLLVRPTRSRLDRLDATWRAAGADVSLRRSLT